MLQLSGRWWHGTRKVALFTIICVVYCAIKERILHSAEQEGRHIGPKWLSLLIWKFLNLFSELVGVRLASEGGEGLQKFDPTRRYIVVWHPHGFITWSALFIMPKMLILGHPFGREMFCGVAPALFRIPIISEIIMLFGARRVDKKVIESYLSKGKMFAIQPGGIKEQLFTRHDQEQAIFPAKLGFIHLALKYGTDLMPTYLFNENQIYKRVDGMEKVSQAIFKYTGFGLPIVTGKFGLPLPLPLKTDIHLRWGAPIKVNKKEHPTDEDVEDLFLKYIDALRSLFYKHAHECLPPAVAAKGLDIIRLDGKPVPLDTFICQGTSKNDAPALTTIDGHVIAARSRI